MDKKELLRNFKLNGDSANRLFYQARNLAIEAMLLRLETRLLRAGFPAQCVWSESSRSSPVIEIRMFNTKRASADSWEFGQCRVVLNREAVQAPEFLSPCVYSLRQVRSEEHTSELQ